MKHPSNSRVQGFMLLEALIALLILAIGLLGITGMQAMSLKNNNSAIMRTQATLLAYDIIDRIRTNKDSDYAISLGTHPPNQNCLVGNDCSPSQMANFDLANWKCSLGSFNDVSICTDLGIQGVLAEGDGTISLVGQTYTVSISWVDGSTGDIKTFEMSAEI
ncbi:MAG: type IV pilus modification protein PilV [Gammaproteobacteria bacterium]|nr:MAG: type IV pilus modification protein PilV [Gammaproteobacteria bacterium]